MPIRVRKKRDGWYAEVQGELTTRDVKKIKRRRIKRVSFNREKGFTGSLRHLEELTDIEQLDIVGNVADAGPIGSMSSLRHLQLESHDESVIDFSGLQNLETCFLIWRSGAETVFNCEKLQCLYLYSYPYPDLAGLDSLESLTSLEVGPAPRLRSLTSLDNSLELRKLGVYHAPNLDEIGPLASQTELRHLSFESCRGLRRIDPVANCINIRRLDLVDCGTIESLNPIRTLNRLEVLFFYGDTIISDGDLNVLSELQSLQFLSFANRRHYSAKCEEFEAYARLDSATHRQLNPT